MSKNLEEARESIKATVWERPIHTTRTVRNALVKLADAIEELEMERTDYAKIELRTLLFTSIEHVQNLLCMIIERNAGNLTEPKEAMAWLIQAKNLLGIKETK